MGRTAPAWVIAIVAAEDGTYWRHSGVSTKHIARAARDNVEAGTVVSGGSTLTQQLAKNLFDRPGRTLEAKWEELDYALHLEKVFDKGDLLTFYANLFHVTGNGSGIGVAARYFFNKEAQELTLLESAYLAGLVKGPANYDPFPGDAERQAAALQRAMDRTRYVLQRIVDEPIENLIPKPGQGHTPITQAQVDQIRAEAKALLDDGFTLPFERGRFRYDSSTLVDEVKRRLQTPFFTDLLASHGIDDAATGGLTVVTTLDRVAQHQATYGLRHHLSTLGTMLEGLGADAFVGGTAPRSSDPPLPHEFRYATVTEHVDGGLALDLGGHPCVVDRDGIVRAAVAVHRGQVKNRYATVPTAEVDGFVEAIADGSVVWVSVRDLPDEGPARCDLELRPELQGAVVVVEDGRFRALVGGTAGKDFDRTRAPRQFGSTFKILVYHAAMTLGWLPDDILDNRRNTFHFSTTRWSPKPDHEPKPQVSLAWAGVDSENLASVWLLYHLIDNLDLAQMGRLAQQVGLAQEKGESSEDYRKRMQGIGIRLTKGSIPGSQFAAARSEVAASLASSGQRPESRRLRTVSFEGGQGGSDSWNQLEPKLQPCRDAHAALQQALDEGTSLMAVRDLSVRIDEDDGSIQVACGTRPEDFVSPTTAFGVGRGSPGGAGGGGGAAPAPRPEGTRTISRQGLPPAPAPTPAPKRKRGKSKTKAQTAPEPAPKADGPELPPPEEMLIEGNLTLGTLEALASAVERQALVMDTTEVDLYAPEVLYGHHDFRILMSMRYVTHVAERYGVQTDLEEVLSLPLGATEITLQEATTMYSGLISGRTVPTMSSDLGPATLIAEIRNHEGDVIYAADLKRKKVAGPEVGQMTADVLRNVVLHGTGKSAREAASYQGALVPIGGKTGTTNDFKNSAFMGYLPAPGAGGFSAADGHAIGVYVGYDDNRPMDVGRIRISGASGSLPAWSATLQGDPQQPGPRRDHQRLGQRRLLAVGPRLGPGGTAGAIHRRHRPQGRGRRHGPHPDPRAPGHRGHPDPAQLRHGPRATRARPRRRARSGWWQFWP